MIKLKAYAKLNLNLHLIPHKLESGYYPVKFINCEINLYDELFFKKIKNNIKVLCNQPEVPKEKDNLVYKAAYLLKNFVGEKDFGVEITLKKNIPVKSGLGGGSSDAVATLKGLIKLWQLKITDGQLSKIVSQLGKDVFYSLKGGICEILGDGSTVNKFQFKMPKLSLVIITPKKEKPSTAWMYNNLDKNKIGKSLNRFGKLKRAIILREKREIINNLFNDFENLAVSYFPIINEIKKDLIKEGAINTLLAGSGLSVVGFFNSENKAKNAVNNLKIKYRKIFYTETK